MTDLLLFVLFSLNSKHHLFSNSSSVGSALPRRRCCAYITIGMICIFIGVGLTVSDVLFCT